MTLGKVRVDRVISIDPMWKRLLIPAVMALMTCEAHGGVHHFAIVREGCALQVSEAGFECLKNQGIEMDA